MGTGKVSVLDGHTNYSLLGWNEDPAALKDLLCAATKA
jgi:hypothetical protein